MVDGCLRSAFNKVGAAALLAVLGPPLHLYVRHHNKKLGLETYFIQTRYGKNESPFPMVKFQTMDKQGRITSIGAWLRRTHLDEFPNLHNVLWGDMHGIGPRPLMESPEEIRQALKESGNDKALRGLGYYYRLKPGITGPDQTSRKVRHAEDGEIHKYVQRFRLAREYYKIRAKGTIASIVADFRIARKTIQVMRRGEGKTTRKNSGVMPTHRLL